MIVSIVLLGFVGLQSKEVVKKIEKLQTNLQTRDLAVSDLPICVQESMTQVLKKSAS